MTRFTRNRTQLPAAAGALRAAPGSARLWGVLLVSALVIGGAVPQARAGAEDSTLAAAMSGGACTVTAKAARIACRNEARDDYWITIGNCSNLADAALRDACIADAALALREARDECSEQLDARLDLCAAVGEAPYDPRLDPADFLTGPELLAATSPNPYFPLVPGTTYRYAGGDETIEVSVTDEVLVVDGIPALAVRDVAREAGEVIEDTVDWYAQDVFGNVWYLGEISQQFEDGELVSLEGSWKAGRDFARPGIIMHAAPVVGDVYRQEFALGDAEDAAEVLSTTGSAASPAASCAGDCLVTRDFTPIEPDALEHKFYAPGLGLILEVDPEIGERVELIEVTP